MENWQSTHISTLVFATEEKNKTIKIWLTCDLSGFVVLAEEGGVEVFSVQVLLTVALLDLSPQLGHGITLGAIPHQADHLLVHTTPEITAQ